jgi:N-acetylglucosamine kinase-like BadF-type ATPase
MNKYVFAYDGGGTKTRLNVVDYSGYIHYDEIAEGSNIFSIGDQHFNKVINGLFTSAKEKLEISDYQIDLVYLGLSGADLEEDYLRLNQACKKIFGEIKFVVVNDAWIILRSGLKTPYGAVCISGTGANAAALDRLGNKAILRALGYTTGTFGGGLDIAREALHYAFRADEMTFEDTLLRYEIPKLFGKETMSDVLELMYPKNTIDKYNLGKITKIVSDCALKDDAVSRMILKHIATHLALQTAGVIKQLGLEEQVIPVVIGGRVFDMEAKYFVECFEEKLKDKVRKAYLVKPKFTPVVGAYLLALDYMEVFQSDEIERNLIESGGKL